MNTEEKAARKINPRKKANPLSKLFYFYMLRIFRRNYKKGLQVNDLYATLDSHKSQILGDTMENVWNQKRKYNKWALHKSFFAIFGTRFIIIGIAQLIMEMSLVLAVPFAVGGLVSYFDSTSEITADKAYMYAGILISSIIFELLLAGQVDFAMDEMSMKMRLSCSSLVYRKALRLSRTALAQTTIGEIVTLLSNDVGKFDENFGLCHYIWIAPLQTAIGTYLLYRMIGVSAFAGIVFLLLFIPLQFYFGKRTATLRLRTALRTDERVRLMNEILSGIQVIKMYTWEKPFGKLISLARRFEIQSIRANFLLESVIFTLDMVLTKIAFLITIIVYVSLGNDISADTVYSVIALYDVLRPSVTVLFSYGISSVSEVHVSMCRVQKFLSYDELPLKQLCFPGSAKNDKQNGSIENKIKYQCPEVLLNEIYAKWESTSLEYTLSDINIKINQPQLLAVIGQVGSGKSSLFNIILRELPLAKGSINIQGKISYASQETWLFSANVRQNILFGEPYTEDRYNTVIKVCALEADLSVLPHGDKTIVGEKGKVLSGGQKARINLARCIYRQADIYLLDDPLSAVDTKVGKQLYDECIAKFLSDKICILITHQLQYLRNADKIIILKEGKIVGEGTYDELQVNGSDFGKLLKEFSSENEDEGCNRKTMVLKQTSYKGDAEKNADDPKVEEEAMETGSIALSVYTGYLRAGGNYWFILVLALAFIATHSANSGGDYYISAWVDLEQDLNEPSPTPEKETLDRSVMIYEYSGIILALTILAAFQSTFFFIFFMRASVNIHDFIFAKISYATMRFFNINPTGRILNRFSKDLGVIDEYIPYILYDGIQILMIFCSVTILTTIVNPWLLLPAIGVAIIFCLLRNIYLETSRTVTRIEGITRSPIFSHMTESMNGLSTIRAFSAQNTLIKEFDNHQDLHCSARFLYISSKKAFSFYLEFICGIIISIVTISLILLERDYYGGEAGLILTQYLSIISLLQWGMHQWSALENNMTSVERTLEYKKVETEPSRKHIPIPRNWPEFGKIIFQNVSMKYNSDEEFVLKNLNFTINSKEKVGVVGRTGAGKSSMIVALFQLYEIEGSIIIDDMDTQTLPLEEVRSKISIIPQDPVLFSGTIRKNLDPFEEYNDDILWSAVEQVKLKDMVLEMPEGLSGNVSEGGSNFSIGQRQLICLARAIVRNNQILVMDEATANVDPHTDSLIQKTIREKFKECTVITIAHRLHTIMDSDRVLVMEAGSSVEFDHPFHLLQNKNGVFHNMVQTTGRGVAKNLHNTAEENFGKLKNV